MNLGSQNNKNTVQIESMNLSRVQRTFHTVALYWLDKTEFPFADFLHTCTMLMMRPDFNKDDASFILKWIEQQRRLTGSNLYKTLRRPNVELKDLKSVKALLARRLELRIKNKVFNAPMAAQPMSTLTASGRPAVAETAPAPVKAKKVAKKALTLKVKVANKKAQGVKTKKASKVKVKALKTKSVKAIKAKSVKARVVKAKKVVLARAKIKVVKKNQKIVKKAIAKTRKLALMKRVKAAVRSKVVVRSKRVVKKKRSA